MAATTGRRCIFWDLRGPSLEETKERPAITTPPKVDDLGYLFDPWDWSEELAVEFAEQEDITLTEDHWVVINFMRDYFEEKMKAPEATRSSTCRNAAASTATACSSCSPMVRKAGLPE